jgi:hypothetical protein
MQKNNYYFEMIHTEIIPNVYFTFSYRFSLLCFKLFLLCFKFSLELIEPECGNAFHVSHCHCI